MNNLKTETEKFISWGLPIFPVNEIKKPMVKEWEKYKATLPLQAEIDEWFKRPIKAIGMACGKLSGIMVVDCDIKNPNKKIDLAILSKLRSEECPKVKTPSGGEHFYFAFDPQLPFTSNAGILPGLDIKSQGGYVLLPPSTVATGSYQWFDPLYEGYQLNPFPQWLLDLIYADGKKFIKKDWQKLFDQTIQQGGRNDTATSIIGKLLVGVKPEEWNTVAWPLLQSWNLTKTSSPLEEEELRLVFESISKAEIQRRNSNADFGTIQINSSEDKISAAVPYIEGFVQFEFTEIESSSREKNCVVKCWLDSPGKSQIPIQERINLLAPTSKREFIRTLKDGLEFETPVKKINWSREVTRVFSEVLSNIRKRNKPVALEEIVPSTQNREILPWVEDQAITILFGDGKTGKSYFALWVGLSVALGIDCLGNKPTQTGNVLFVDYEDNKDEFGDRMFRLLSAYNFTPEQIKQKFFYYRATEPIMDLKYILDSMIHENNIKLIIVDSANGAAFDDISRQDVASKVTNTLNFFNRAVLLITHQTKEGGEKYPFGSIFWNNAARCTWNVKKAEKITSAPEINMGLLNRTRNHGAEFAPVGVKITFKPDQTLITEEKFADNFENALPIPIRILSILKTPATYKEVAKKLGITDNQAAVELNRLKNKKIPLVSNDQKGNWILVSNREEPPVFYTE